MNTKKVKVMFGALVALAVCGASAQMPNLLIELDATDFNPATLAWPNKGTLGSAFMPADSGAGISLGMVDGITAVSLVGNSTSVMTNMVSPNVLCGAAPWTFEVWVHNPAALAGQDVMFTWTAREQWPSGGADRSCVEFRYGQDAGNAVEHYGNENLAWGGALPAFGQWHHVAVTRDAGGEERLYLDGVLRIAQFRTVNARDDIGFFTIGAVQDRNNSGWIFPFSGSFARLRVYDGPLAVEDLFTNMLADQAAFGLAMPSARYWKGTPGNWDAWATGANWVGGGVPLDNDIVIFENGGKAGGFAGTLALQDFKATDGGFGMTGGSLTVPVTVGMGYGTGRSFDFQLTGGTFNVPGSDNHHLILGWDGGTATTVIGGGSTPAWLCLDKDIIIGNGRGSLSHMTVSTDGLATVSNGWVIVAANGNATGTLVVAGGTVSGLRDNNIVLGNGGGSQASLILNAGTVGPFGMVTMSDNNPNMDNLAELFLNGGLLWIRRFNPNSNGRNYVYLNGGTILNRDGRGDFMGNLTAAYMQAGGVCFDVIANTTIEVYQPLLEDPSSLGGGLTKQGPGTLVLRGANTFTGDITVGGGALLLRNDDALPGGYAGNILLQGGGIGWDSDTGANDLLALLDPLSDGTLFLFAANATENIDFSGHPGLALGMTGNMDYQGTLSPPPPGGSYRFTIIGGANQYRQVIAGNVGLILEEASTGHLGLHGNNTYTGDTLINGGVLYVYHLNATGTPSTKQNARDIGIYNGAALMIDIPVSQQEMDAFVARIKTDSLGTILLCDANRSLDFDFSALPGVTLGSPNWRDFGGTLTPHASVGYHLGGGGQNWWDNGIRVRNLTDAPGNVPRKLVVEFPGTVDLADNNFFSGGIIVTNKAVLWIRHDATLGEAPPAPVADHLYLDDAGMRIEVGDRPQLMHPNRGMAIGDGGARLYPAGSSYTAWRGDLSGSGPIAGLDNGVILFGGANNTWDGTLTMGSGNEDGTFGVGFGPDFSWVKSNIIQGNGMFGIGTDQDITWSDKFAQPLGNVPPQHDTPSGTAAPLGLRKLGAGTLTLDVPNTYRRNTRIENGTLKVGIADAIPWGNDRGNMDFRNNNLFPQGILDLNGFDVNVNGLWGPGLITNSQGGPQTLTFGNGNRDGTFYGTVDPLITAIKAGDNQQRLWKGARLGDLTVERGYVYAGAETAFSNVALNVMATPNATFYVGLSQNDAYGLTGEYYHFDSNELRPLVGPGTVSDLLAFEALLDLYAPAHVQSSWSFGAGFDAGSNGGGFQGDFHNRSSHYGRWTGEFYAEADGEYGFATASDDGSAVYLNRTLVVSNDYDQGYGGSKLGGTITLTKGWHDIIIAHYQGGGDRGLTAYMTPPGGEEDVLPQALLRPYPVTVASLSGTGGSRLEIFGNGTLDIAGETPATFGGRLVAASTDARLIKNGAADLILSGQSLPEFNGQIIVNDGNLGLLDASPTTRPIRIRDGGTLFALAASGNLPTRGLKGTYYWGWYGGTSFEGLDGEFAWRQPIAEYSTMQTGVDALPTAQNFWYEDRNYFPGTFSAQHPPAGERPNFCARYKGKFIAFEPGNYTFGLATDNRGDLFLNGEQIIAESNWDTNEKTATRHLDAGAHDLQIAYGYWGGGGNVRVRVAPPGGEMIRLPNAWLRPSVSMIYGIEGDGDLCLPDNGAYLCLKTDVPTVFPGEISGVQGSELEKNGADTLTLTGNNDAFAGDWLVLNGTLIVGDGGVAGTLGGESVYVGAGGLLLFNRSDDYTYTGRIAGEGEIRSIGSGRVILTGGMGDFKGTFSSGTFIFSGESASVPPGCLSQGQGLAPLTVHFENGAQLALPPASAGPLSLPPLVFSNGTITLPFEENASYTIDSLMISAGTTLSCSVNSISGLFGRYFYFDGNQWNNDSISPYFTSLADADIFFSGLEPFCVASTWEAGDVIDFGSFDHQATHPLKFPPVVITRESNFAAFWKGKINITTPGTHTFETWSDDNSMLYIDGNLIVDNNGGHGMQTRSGQVDLSEGLHDITILFAQGGGGYGLTVSIAIPGYPLQLLPNSMLVTDPADIADLAGTGYPGTDVSGMAFTIELGTLGVVNGPGTGTLDITDGGGLLNGKLLLNNLFIQAPGAVIATAGKTAISGSHLNLIMGEEPLPGLFFKVADFDQAPGGLSFAGKTRALVGADKGRLITRGSSLYVSTVNGTVLILR